MSEFRVNFTIKTDILLYKYQMDEYSMRAQEQISELKEKYSELLEGARRNETILRKFQNFEIQLMDSESLEEFLDQVICHSKEIFNWDYVTLVLVDSDYEIQRLFEQSDHEITDNPNLFLFTKIPA
ncbi:MAG: DUF484 family protein [Gammaproteobacteria bacterium]